MKTILCPTIPGWKCLVEAHLGWRVANLALSNAHKGPEK
jgi:hypothetical protein